MENNQSQITKIETVVTLYTGMVLDAVESAVGETSYWPSLRPKLLKILGDRGLKLRIKEIVEPQNPKGANQ